MATFQKSTIDLVTPFVLGPGLSLLGRFASSGRAIVQGHFSGELVADTVIVLPGGRISGTVVAHEVVLEGESDSEIYADRIALRPGCFVTGELYHAELKLEAGADFEGKSRRYPDPRRYAPNVSRFS